MNKQKKKQFDQLLDQATSQLKNDIAKREVIHFRLNEQSLKYLQNIAANKKLHVGALVRNWVLERLEDELEVDNNKETNFSKNNSQLQLKVTELQNDLEQMRKHISALKKCL